MFWKLILTDKYPLLIQQNCKVYVYHPLEFARKLLPQYCEDKKRQKEIGVEFMELSPDNKNYIHPY